MFSQGFGGFDFGGYGGHEHHDEAMHEEKDNDTDKLYQILGLTKDCTSDEIRKQYKKFAIKLHPDKGGNPEKFKELCEAYEILSKPEKREIYDKYGKDGLKDGGQGGSNPFDIFENMFGRGRSKKQAEKKGKPQLIPLKVTLEDVYQGKMYKYNHKKKQICDDCQGQGGKNVQKCKPCKGRGVVEKLFQLAPGMYQQSQQACQDCRGEGKCMNEKDICKQCKGKKVIEQKKQIEIAIEQGVPHDHDYIFTGESDEFPGIIAGDVYFRIQIEPHKTFTRKGADLYIEKKITLLEALTGYTFEFKHLDKKKIKITTLPGDIISHNQFKTIKGKGMPFFQDKMSFGHLFINFQIEFPKIDQFNEQQINNLKNVLPGPQQLPIQKGENVEYLDDFYEQDLNPNAQGGNRGNEDEDEQHARQQGQGVQCQQQ